MSPSSSGLIDCAAGGRLILAASQVTGVVEFASSTSRVINADVIMTFGANDAGAPVSERINATNLNPMAGWHHRKRDALIGEGVVVSKDQQDGGDSTAWLNSSIKGPHSSPTIDPEAPRHAHARRQSTQCAPSHSSCGPTEV